VWVSSMWGWEERRDVASREDGDADEEVEERAVVVEELRVAALLLDGSLVESDVGSLPVDEAS
jgi:hypothetical protein